MAPKPVPSSIDLSIDASIDKARGVLIIGEREIDLHILEVITEPRPDILWRFAIIDGLVMCEPVEDLLYIPEKPQPKRKRKRKPASASPMLQ